jgi:cysteine-rich repeat protein
MRRSIGLLFSLGVVACLNDNGVDGPYVGTAPVVDAGTVCSAGEVSCDETGFFVKICDNDNFTLVPCGDDEYCSAGRCEEHICEPDQRICDGTEARLCNGFGSAFAETTDCAEDNRLCHDGACVDAECGNGTLEAGEVCDDGNLDNTDACTNVCRPAVCGDGILRDGVEECDDANQLQTDACLTDCTAASCGDGHVQAGVDGCDDGNQNDADRCDNTCRLTTSPFSLGQRSNCILRSGVPYCMGHNDFGAVGDGTHTNRSQPTRVLNLTGVVQLSGTFFTQCALKSDGTVWCWGRNNHGQLGDGTNTSRNQPVQVVTLANIVELDGGAYSSCARRSDGTLWCWGFNSFGQIGDGSTTNRNRPVQVRGIDNVIQIAAGFASCARLGDGTTWCWGQNQVGQVGDGTNNRRTTPVRVSNDSGFIDLQAGYSHTCARKANGTLWCWGLNASGQLGDGTATNRNVPTQVLNVSDATAVAVGGDQKTCAIRAGGLMWCWGYNSVGALGDGTTTSRSAPVRVSGLGAVTHIARGGAGHGNFARTATNETYAWGNNVNGSLGLGNANHQTYTTPQRVPGF